MKGYLANLKPFERRLVVVVGLVFFVVFNLVFVRPYFSDWSVTQTRLAEAQEELDKYEKQFQLTNSYTREIRSLENESSPVPAEDQALHFSSTIIEKAAQSGVSIIQTSKISTRTNQLFFIELSQSLSVQSSEPQLVDFLYQLGSGASAIRVRDLSVRPDQPHYQLVANIKLVASYQKKTPAKNATSPGRTSANSSAATTPSSTAKRP
jgi:type II secretory pathway component PulM